MKLRVSLGILATVVWLVILPVQIANAEHSPRTYNGNCGVNVDSLSGWVAASQSWTAGPDPVSIVGVIDVDNEGTWEFFDSASYTDLYEGESAEARLEYIPPAGVYRFRLFLGDTHESELAEDERDCGQFEITAPPPEEPQLVELSEFDRQLLTDIRSLLGWSVGVLLLVACSGVLVATVRRKYS